MYREYHIKFHVCLLAHDRGRQNCQLQYKALQTVVLLRRLIWDILFRKASLVVIVLISITIEAPQSLKRYRNLARYVAVLQ